MSRPMLQRICRQSPSNRLHDVPRVIASARYALNAFSILNFRRDYTMQNDKSRKVLITILSIAIVALLIASYYLYSSYSETAPAMLSQI